MKTYIIERDIPGVGGLDAQQKAGAAAKSNEVLAQLAPKVKWRHSFLAKDKTFCVYEAENEAVILEHARLSGFPANKITEVAGMLDPSFGG